MQELRISSILWLAGTLVLVMGLLIKFFLHSFGLKDLKGKKGVISRIIESTDSRNTLVSLLITEKDSPEIICGFIMPREEFEELKPRVGDPFDL